jgi:hypothetical protein
MSRYSCLSLVKYPKLLLSYHLGLDSDDLCLLTQKCVYYFPYLIHYCCITLILLTLFIACHLFIKLTIYIYIY